jgi:hypothetical protein
VGTESRLSVLRHAAELGQTAARAGAIGDHRRAARLYAAALFLLEAGVPAANDAERTANSMEIDAPFPADIESMLATLLPNASISTTSLDCEGAEPPSRTGEPDRSA